MILETSVYLGNEIIVGNSFFAIGLISNKPQNLSKLWSNLIGTKLKLFHNAHIIPDIKA